jgi:hypothetical protein
MAGHSEMAAIDNPCPKIKMRSPCKYTEGIINGEGTIFLV